MGYYSVTADNAAYYRRTARNVIIGDNLTNAIYMEHVRSVCRWPSKLVDPENQLTRPQTLDVERTPTPIPNNCDIGVPIARSSGHPPHQKI